MKSKKTLAIVAIAIFSIVVFINLLKKDDPQFNAVSGG
jgi:hypothetical protein